MSLYDQYTAEKKGTAGSLYSQYLAEKQGIPTTPNVVGVESNKMGAGEAFGRAAAFQAVPTTGAIASGIAGAKGGAIVGSAFGPAGTAIGAVVGAIGGGILGAVVTSKAQEKALQIVKGDEWLAKKQEQLAQGRKDRPLASFTGEVAPQLLTLKPSPQTVIRATKFAQQVLTNPKTASALLKTPAGKAQLDDLINVSVGGSAELGTEVYTQAKEGDFNALRLIAAGTVGSLINQPNRFGMRMGMRPSGEMELTPEVKTPIEGKSTGQSPVFEKYQQETSGVTQSTKPTDYVAAVTKTATEKGLPNASQIGKDLGALYKIAEGNKPIIDGIITDVSKEIPGSVPMTTPLKGTLKTGFDPSRAIDKFAQKGDITDLSRNTLLINNLEDAPKALEGLKSKGAVLEEGKDFFAQPTHLGYRGMNLKYYKNGGGSEIQVQIPEVMLYKNAEKDAVFLRDLMGGKMYDGFEQDLLNAGIKPGRGHEIFETVRNYELTAIKEGRYFKTSSGEEVFRWTPSEEAIVRPLINESKEGYEKVIELARQRATNKTDASKEAPRSLESEKFASRVYERMQAENPEVLTGNVEATRVNLKQDADRAVDLITKDKQKAFRVAMGAESSSDVTSTSVNIALAEKALDEGNTALYGQLIKNRSLEQTRRGQEIVAERGSISDNSTSKYVKELLAARLDKLGDNYLSNLKPKKRISKKGKGIEALDKQVKEAQTKVANTRELDLKEAQSIIDKLIC